MSAVPRTNTICNTAAEPCGTPGSGGACAASGAAVSTDTPFVTPTGVETLVDFDVDNFEYGGDDADSLNERIVVGNSAVYTVTYDADYGVSSPGSTMTVRIKVGGITQKTDVHPLGAVPTHHTFTFDIQLAAGQALTATVLTNVVGEGVEVTRATLAAIKNCGTPSGEVIIPQG
jgi:hypothetical protein